MKKLLLMLTLVLTLGACSMVVRDPQVSSRISNLEGRIRRLEELVNRLAMLGLVAPDGGSVDPAFPEDAFPTLTVGAGAVMIDKDGITIATGSGEEETIQWKDEDDVVQGLIRTNLYGGGEPAIEIIAGDRDNVEGFAAVDYYAYSQQAAGDNPYYAFLEVYSEDAADADLLWFATGHAFPGTGYIPFLIRKGAVAGDFMFILNALKSTTGDPTGEEGMLTINTFDNKIKIYADGAWRQIATW